MSGPAGRLDKGLAVSRHSVGDVESVSGNRQRMGDLVDIATRSGGGIEVALIWNRDQRTLVVFAHDATTSEELAIPVSGEEATEVYRHPFAYAHRSADADGKNRS